MLKIKTCCVWLESTGTARGRRKKKGAEVSVSTDTKLTYTHIHKLPQEFRQVQALNCHSMTSAQGIKRQTPANTQNHCLANIFV
jgi:hypothetical protein